MVQQQFLLAQTVRYETQKGKIRIEGTSNIDDWQVESKNISGYLEAAPGFPGNLSPADVAHNVAGRSEIFIQVDSLRSVEKDGKPFSNLMDKIMQAKLKLQENPNIRYRLKDLILVAQPKTQEEAYRFESRGELVVAGVTNHIAMPINVARINAQRLKIWGNTALRMTDFNIEPPAPKIALGVVKTGDEVKIGFEWVLAEAGRPHSGATAENLPR